MKKLKMLHMGRGESLSLYTPHTEFTDAVTKVTLPLGLPVADYVKALPDADIIVVDAMGKVPGELIQALPDLKLIHSNGAGFNFIDIKAAAERGIPVCNCAGMNGEAVAEQTLLLMLGVLRDVANNDRAVREGRQIQVKEAYMSAGSLHSLSEYKVGLIGLGHIGMCTAKLLKAFHVQTFYTQRRRKDVAAEQEYGVTWLPTQDELLGSCDIVSIHVPVTPQTERMCNEAFFSRMKPGSYFINTSRGELVDDEALIAALQSGRLRMAGLDTLDMEPVRKDHRLLNLPEEIASKILFSPHIGGITAGSFRKGYEMIWDNVQRLAEGQLLDHVVNGVRNPYPQPNP